MVVLFEKCLLLFNDDVSERLGLCLQNRVCWFESSRRLHMQIIKIQGKRATIERSGRGYVAVKCGPFHVLKEIDSLLKTKLSSDIAGWNKEMYRSENEAISECRLHFK